MEDQPVPSAFLLGGAFRVVCRNHRFLAELARRGLRILVVTPESSRAQAEAVMARPGPAAEQISDIAFVDGAMEIESSFNSGVLAAARHWLESYRIVGAYAMEEMLVEPMGLVCDALGLPFPGLRASRACRSKYLQRVYLDRFGPESLIVPPGCRTGLSLDSIKVPAVVKPAARHASSGVVECQTTDEIATALEAYPGHETVLIEQKVAGPEFSVESLVQNGESCFASLTRKETNHATARTFVELSHTVPAGPTRIGGRDTVAAVLEANHAILRHLGFENGIAHSEWRVTDSGEPFLMEIAARTPGDGLTILYGLASGQPMETQIIKIALGETVTYPAPRRYARQVYLEHPPGILRDVAVDWPGVTAEWIGQADLWPPLIPGEASDGPALRAVLVLQSRGSRLKPLSSSDDRAVTFFIDADSTAALDAIEAAVRAAITVDITPDTERTDSC
jgi:hypothetical protein